MSRKLEYFGRVDDKGILKLFNRDGFSDDLQAFLEQDVKITVEIKNKRSLLQNGFYWSNYIRSQIDCFKERFGETYRPSQVHDWNKTNIFGTEHINEATGEAIMMPESSAAQSTTEFEDKLEYGRQWFRQNMDWELPIPEKQEKIKY